MNRIKSKVVFKNALKSPSPDKHTSNKIVRTNSPAQEVAQAKKNIIKKHNNNNNNNISNSNNNSNVQNRQKHIKQLEQKINALQQELREQEKYSEQFKQLLIKNKKLQQQMFMILKQLQNKNTSSQVDIHEYGEYQSLRQHIRQLQEIISQLSNRYTKLQNSVRNVAKKDLNVVQHKLMNYIFGLQQRITNINIINNNHGELQRTMKHNPESSIKIDVSADKISQRPIQESTISMMNIQISPQRPHQLYYNSKYNTLKKERDMLQCRNCEQYRREVQELRIRIDQDDGESKVSCRKGIKNRDVLQKINVLQSNINVAIDSSIEQGLVQSKQISSNELKTQMFLQQIRNKLIQLSQQIRVAVNQPQPSQQHSVRQLLHMNRVQESQIVQLEYQAKKLINQVQQKQNKIQKLQKLLKSQIIKHEEEQISSGRLPPISCVNHEETKRKLKEILTLIKNLEAQWDNRTI